MASRGSNNGDDQPGVIGNTGGTVSDFTDKESALKLEKSRAKSSFTRVKNKLLFLVESEDIGTSREVHEACNKLDTCLEEALDVMARLSGLYSKNKEKEKGLKVALESDKLEEDYSSTYVVARHYLRSLKGEQSSETSEILTIDMLNRMNIDDNTGTYEKRDSIGLQEKSKKVGIFDSRDKNPDHEIVKNKEPPSCMETLSPELGLSHVPEKLQSNGGIMNWVASGVATPLHEEPQKHCGMTTGENQSTMNAQAVPFEPAASYTAPSIGLDMWRQLKRVEIPTFSGEKKNYQSWKAAFLSCIDSAPATGEYKLLQIRQYLSGDALKVIDSLGHSATAYEAAKDRLERKYGGKRRQIAIYLEELDQFRQIRQGNARDIEEFADLLDIAMINHKEAGQDYELRDGSLYTKLQRKLPETMLTQYHRWIFENQKDESVMTLRTWVLQEAEFRTIASETVHGFAGRMANNAPARPVPRYGSQRTFFGETKDQRMTKFDCRECGKQHGIWSCRIFAKRNVRDRWNIARRLQLCYRCLSEDHQGKPCPRSRTCGQDGCVDMHHRLLHKQKTGEVRRPINDSMAVKLSEDNGTSKTRRAEQTNTLTDRTTFLTEGNDPGQETTMVTQGNMRPDFIGLRTVPVILINGNRSLRVNALLDDASTKTYVNADVAAELGLQGRTERVKVNVLNGQIETFETKPVDVTLQSVAGNVSMKINAYTVNKVTGNMPVVDWNRYKHQWPHLRNIDFPSSSRRPIVDVLIGLDCADLLYGIEERRGNPGDPIARLTPLGWTCVGCPGSYYEPTLQTNFAYTYFLREQSEIEQVNRTLKKFWDIEDVSAQQEMPVVRIEEQMAMKTVEKSIIYENQMYRVGIPWKTKAPDLKNKYQMALRRLENTEKRLLKSPDVASAYNQCIEQYIEKGYVTRIPQQDRSTSKWFLPHFPILRPDKDTTKTRIVFDASAKYEGMSLNDAIYQGPKLQRNLLMYYCFFSLLYLDLYVLGDDALIS